MRSSDPPRRATYADLEKVPPTKIGELIQGVLHVSPRPAAPHAVAATSLGGCLFDPFFRGKGGPGGWVLLDEPELHLGEDVLVPDLAGWRRERMPVIPEEAFFTLVPDWVCEVISPSTAALDRADKLPVYAAAHVSHAWLVDPKAKTLEVLRLEGETWRVLGVWKEDASVRAEPFDAIELEHGLLWQR